METLTPFSFERFAPSGPMPRIDRERGLVRGIRAAGPTSRNGRRYPAEVLRAAVPLYDSVPVNIDHHAQGTDVPAENRFGRLTTPRFVDGGIVCDLEFNPVHPFADRFLWACEHNPTLYGFSHVARVRWSQDAEGHPVAEKILEVASVDIVADPAVTRTIFESFPGATMTLDPASVSDGDQLTSFLRELLAAVQLDEGTKAAALATLLEESSECAVTPALESFERLRRLGPLGRRAWEELERLRHDESRRSRREFAQKLVREEALPDHLCSDLFLDLVAESQASPDRARAIIRDRRALLGNSIRPRTTLPSSGRSLRELVAECP